MPHVTEHTPKVPTRSVNSYACESSREKRQQDRQTARQTDRQTDRQTHRRLVQNHFSRRFGGCTSQIRSYLEVDFLHDANTSIDMEVKLASLHSAIPPPPMAAALRATQWATRSNIVVTQTPTSPCPQL